MVSVAGRNYSAEVNAVYTLSGAFSAFRKSAVLKSQLYNTDTICEDTQITFQMKYLQKTKVGICEDAIFFVDPIEDMNKLYTQRQRWQRGSLEVSHLFLKDKLKARNMLTNDLVSGADLSFVYELFVCADWIFDTFSVWTLCADRRILLYFDGRLSEEF